VEGGSSHFPGRGPKAPLPDTVTKGAWNRVAVPLPTPVREPVTGLRFSGPPPAMFLRRSQERFVQAREQRPDNA
jgi:hypothetical protein